MTDLVRVLVQEATTVRVLAEPVASVLSAAVLPGPPGPRGQDGAAQVPADYMSQLVYDPRGFEIDVFDLSHMTGTLDAGTF